MVFNDAIRASFLVGIFPAVRHIIQCRNDHQSQCGRHQNPEDQRNGEAIENRIVQNKESTDHGCQTRQNNRLSPGNGTLHNGAFEFHAFGNLQVNKVDQQNGVAHDNTRATGRILYYPAG